MSKETLSPKQEQILSFIKQHISEKGYPPTIRGICEAVGLSSTASVHSQLNTLEKKYHSNKCLKKLIYVRNH